MGKSGDLLRAQKAEKKTYVFTAVQLAAHDKFIVDEAHEKLKAMAKEEVQKEWDKREAMFNAEDFAGNFMLIISMLLAVSSKVLVEQFKWTPIPKDKYFTNRYRLARFGNAIVDEINGVCMDEKSDIRVYCDEVYEKYGVKFISEEDDDASKE